MAVRPQDSQFLLAQHHVSVHAVEEGQQAAIALLLLMTTVAGEQRAHLVCIQIAGLQQPPAREQGGGGCRRFGVVRSVRRRRFGQRERLVEAGKIVRVTGSRVIREQSTEESRDS
jgi:hypothetical protein